MSNIALIPQDVPGYILSASQAKALNADAVDGISTGFPASIRIDKSSFKVVDGSGTAVTLRPSDLVNGESLNVVVLAARPGLAKSFYSTAFDPSQTEGSAPDCLSNDGIRPDASVATPQCNNCAACPKNAFGSGRNQAGQATLGKACSDNKILALFRNGSVYRFKVPPASLKNWGAYVKELSNRGIPLGNVLTFISFDFDAKFTTLVFRVGGWVPENAMGKLAALSSSQEVVDITKPAGFSPALPASAPAPTPVAAPAPPPAPAPAEDQMGFDFDDAPAQTATPAQEAPARRGRPKKSEETVVATPAPAPAPAQVAPSAVMSDDDIAKALGL